MPLHRGAALAKYGRAASSAESCCPAISTGALIRVTPAPVSRVPALATSAATAGHHGRRGLATTRDGPARRSADGRSPAATTAVPACVTRPVTAGIPAHSLRTHATAPVGRHRRKKVCRVTRSCRYAGTRATSYSHVASITAPTAAIQGRVARAWSSARSCAAVGHV